MLKTYVLIKTNLIRNKNNKTHPLFSVYMLEEYFKIQKCLKQNTYKKMK